MNKKKVTGLLFCVLLLVFSACEVNRRSSGEDLQDQNEGTAAAIDTEEEAAPKENTGEVDVDLTILSSTMVYGEVYQMMLKPEEFAGKVIRMNGTYTYAYDETEEKHYDACIIQDATACCAQGILFELTEDYAYPDDYPEDGENVTVKGTFETYRKDGFVYCVLKDAVLEGEG